MNPMISYQEFPVNVLPPILANTIYEVANQTKAPLAMIATAVLGAMSLTCQNRINICRMGELIAPCSLYILSIADSGERKTAIDNILMKPIYELEKTLLNEYKSELTAFNARTFEWEQKKKIITSKLKKAIQSNNEYDYLTKEMEDLFINQPEQPKRKQINFNDATPASIKTYLGEHSKSIGIMSDEGGTIINAKIVDDLSFLNKLWDGSNYSTERKTTPSNHINNARLTISIMVQYGVLKTYLTRRGENARSSGFLARFLVCYPPSTQGTRYITNPVISTEHVHEFHKRIKSIMYESQSLDSSDSQMLLLNLDPEAQQCWINYYNEIESPEFR